MPISDDISPLCCGGRGPCTDCPFFGTPKEKNVTVGRKKRKRRKGAGKAVKVKPHYRSPRGPNRGKKRVKVDPYARGKGAAKRKRKRK